MPEQARLRLFTSGDWSLNDLRGLIAAVDGLYGLALAIQLRSRGRGVERAVVEQPSVAYRRVESYRPSAWLSTAGERAFPLVEVTPELQHVGLLYRRRELIAPEEQLRIESIVMRSPGSISLLGLGELVHAIRELIKDFTFRNRQERELGNLEIIRQRLAIGEQFSQLAGDELALTALDFLSDVRSLEANGKLRLSYPSSAARDLRTRFTEALAPESRALPQVRHAERVFSELESEIENEDFGLVDRTIESLRRQINEARKAGAINNAAAADLRRKLAELNGRLALDAGTD